MTIDGYYDTGKNLIKKVIITIALLGLSGTVLYLINPNFFYQCVGGHCEKHFS